MDTKKRESRQDDVKRSRALGSNDEIWGNCCGSEIAGADQMMRSCPCTSMFKGSRGSICIILAVSGLLFSITAAGWVLGVVGFFRTL